MEQTICPHCGAITLKANALHVGNVNVAGCAPQYGNWQEWDYAKAGPQTLYFNNLFLPIANVAANPTITIIKL